jgi:competence protein ComEC
MIKNLFLLICVLFLIFYDVTSYRFQKYLTIHFIDVGQGDAILIQTVDNKYVLIDGGPSSDLLSSLGELMSYSQFAIDLVVATHGDSDHINGLVEVAERYRVDKFLHNGEVTDTLTHKELFKKLNTSKTEILLASRGNKITVGCCLELSLLWPDQSLAQELDTNDRSVSMILDYIDFELYLAGDLSYEIEERITEAITINVEIMKLSHHGSRTSTSERLIKNLNADKAIISAGNENKYGHPHKEVLEMLDDARVEYFRTDLQGNIKVVTDGKSQWITTSKNPTKI